MGPRSRAAYDAWITRRYGPNRPKCLIIDYITRKDSPYEGRIIAETVANIGWKPRLVEKPPRWGALDPLASEGNFEVIHITAHGSRNSLFRTEDEEEEISASLIESAFDGYQSLRTGLSNTKLVVNSACNTISKEWLGLFLTKLHAHHYIGVNGKPSLEEGIAFPIALYLSFWHQKKFDVERAFNEAKKTVRTAAEWELH